MKRRTIITAALLGTALTVGLILYLCAQLDNRGFSVTSTGPLDIRLWGIRPDAGDSIYDPNGKKIMETFGLAREDMTAWKDTSYRRDFIFEVPDADEAVLFYGQLRLLVDGREKEQVRASRARSFSFYHKGRTLWWLQMNIPRTVVKSFLFGTWSKQVPVDRVDMNLRYYCGPPYDPICIFKGPFEVGRKVVDETGLHEISLSLTSDAHRSKLNMMLSPGRRIDSHADAVFYNAGGKYKRAAGRWSRTDPNNPVIMYHVSGLRLTDIDLITIGEKPFEMKVRNLSLRSPNAEHRTYAEHLDEIAERLNPGSDPTRHKWPNYSIFSDLNGAMKVIDVIRGGRIKQACERYCNPRDIATLDADQLQRLKRTVLRWAGAMDPEIFVPAIESGLRCGWPEFVDVALDILEHPHRRRSRIVNPTGDVAAALSYFTFRGQLSDRQVQWRVDAILNILEKSLRDHSRTVNTTRDVAAALPSSSFRGRLSDGQAQRIVEIVPRYTDDRIIDKLFHFLDRPKSPAQITALWNLADHDQPWLWVRALEELYYWGHLKGKFDELSEKMKVRLFLIISRHWFTEPDQIEPKASELLPTLLSGDLLTQHSNTFSTLVRRLPESVDRRAMTAAIIESFRNMEYRRQGWSIWTAICLSVQHLNLWYGLDIGCLGSDYGKKIWNLDTLDLEAIATEAVVWYDTEYNRAAPNTRP